MKSKIYAVLSMGFMMTIFTFTFFVDNAAASPRRTEPKTEVCIKNGLTKPHLTRYGNKYFGGIATANIIGHEDLSISYLLYISTESDVISINGAVLGPNGRRCHDTTGNKFFYVRGKMKMHSGYFMWYHNMGSPYNPLQAGSFECVFTDTSWQTAMPTCTKK